MVPFGGWDMPVEYSGLISEHMAVRTAAGLFDVSHMGEFEVEGPGAIAFLQRSPPTTWRSSPTARPSTPALPMANGAPVDDVIVYPPRRRPLPDGGQRGQHREGLQAGCRPAGRASCELANRSDDYALLALQGPRAEAILQPLTAIDLAALKYYHFAEGQRGGRGRAGLAHRLHRRGRLRDLRRPASAPRRSGSGCSRPARTPASSPPAWARATPCASRRRMCLYGNDMDETHDAGRGGPGLDRLPRRGQGRLPGPRRAGRAEEAGRRASWSASRWWAAASPATATPCS